MKTVKQNHVKRILRLTDSPTSIIHQYLNLNIGKKHVATPYYINSNYEKPIVRGKVLANIHFNYVKKKTKQRALIGKGNPQEVEKVTLLYARRHNLTLNTASAREIKRLMETWQIGIDCSGLVVWILNEFIKEKYGEPVWHYIKLNTKNIIKKVLFHLRPVENISVKVLSHSMNSIQITNICDIHVGDMIIGWYDEHVLLITEIGLGKDNKPCYFEYINSTWWYGEHNGVVKGRVDITNPKGYLTEQSWEDFQKGKNWTYEGIKHDGKIVRLKVLHA